VEKKESNVHLNSFLFEKITYLPLHLKLSKAVVFDRTVPFQIIPFLSNKKEII